jgi:hypothetical protein
LVERFVYTEGVGSSSLSSPTTAFVKNCQFRDKGDKLQVEIVDFPNGVPGDVAMTLK